MKQILLLAVPSDPIFFITGPTLPLMDKKKVGQFHIHFSPQSVGKIRIQIKPVFFIKRDYTSGIFLVEDLNYLFSRLRTRIKKSAPFTVKKNVRIQITGYLPIGTDPDSEV